MKPNTVSILGSLLGAVTVGAWNYIAARWNLPWWYGIVPLLITIWGIAGLMRRLQKRPDARQQITLPMPLPPSIEPKDVEGPPG